MMNHRTGKDASLLGAPGLDEGAAAGGGEGLDRWASSDPRKIPAQAIDYELSPSMGDST
jgi:hypothetical protein